MLTPDKSELNILYSNDGFVRTTERSNLFRIIITSGCSLKWSAELVWDNDLIASFKQADHDLFAWTFKGILLKLNEKTGDILESELVK